jgi:hypothetical protein
MVSHVAESYTDLPRRNEIFEPRRYITNYEVPEEDNIYAELIKYGGLGMVGRHACINRNSMDKGGCASRRAH